MTLIQLGIAATLSDTADVGDIIKTRETLFESVRTQIALLLEQKGKENMTAFENGLGTPSKNGTHIDLLNSIISEIPRHTHEQWQKKTEIIAYLVAKVEQEYKRYKNEGYGDILGGNYPFMAYYLGYIKNLDLTKFSGHKHIMEEIRRIYTYHLDSLSGDFDTQGTQYEKNNDGARSYVRSRLLHFGIEDIYKLPY